MSFVSRMKETFHTHARHSAEEDQTLQPPKARLIVPDNSMNFRGNYLNSAPHPFPRERAEGLFKSKTPAPAAGIDIRNLYKMGVRIELLRAVLAGLTEDREGITVRELVEIVIKPMTIEANCSFVEMMHKKHLVEPHPALDLCFANACRDDCSCFVSYSWDSSFASLVELLEELLIDEPETAPVFWIDIFCLNQLRASELSRKMLLLKRVVRELKRVVLLIPDFLSAAPVKRSWVLYEAWVCLACNGEFSLLIPNKDKSLFGDVIFDTADKIIFKLCNIDFKSSVVSVSEDKEMMIMDIVSDGDDGVKRFNKLLHMAVKRCVAAYVVRYCMHKLGMEYVRTVEILPFCANANKVAYLLCEASQFVAAESLFNLTLCMYEERYGMLHPDTLGVANNMVFVLYSLGKKDQAEATSCRVIEGYRGCYGQDHANTIAAMIAGADMLKNHDKLSEAEGLYRNVHLQLLNTRGAKHPSTIAMVHNLAHLMYKQRKLKDAEVLYKQALAQYTELYSAQHEITSDIAYDYGMLLFEKKEYVSAKELFQTSHVGFLTVLGSDHHFTLEAKRQMINCAVQLQKREEAICVLS